MSGDSNYSVSDEITPSGAPFNAGASNITVDAVNAGTRIANAIEFAQLGDSANINKDFALGSDIDLTGTGTVWTGPDGYTGHFYGNGYTIKGLVLSAAQINGGFNAAGLFSSLGSGATISDFIIEVSTEDPDMNIAGIGFGGVTGYVVGEPVTIENVHVRGNLEFGSIDTFTSIGAIIGEIEQNKSAVIDRCGSELNIKVKNITNTTNNTRAVGGLLGVLKGNVEIRDSYVTGDINIKSTSNTQVKAGGLVGYLYHMGNPQLTIDRCYAAGNIIIDCSSKIDWLDSSGTFVTGGLIGLRNAGVISASNSVALNKKVLSIISDTGYQNKSVTGRIIGNSGGSNTFANNAALLGMLTGFVDGSASANNSSGDANSYEGIGKTETAFKSASFWMNAVPSGLGWSADIWDFDGLNKSGADFYWPRLK
ncbi:MAG: hypothetical protein Pg6A_19400 [Termitinemataceae bacterium]|nr:MAG: hypothetical protein Pg6A_19400 [Termitinemataceae bacterium]